MYRGSETIWYIESHTSDPVETGPKCSFRLALMHPKYLGIGALCVAIARGDGNTHGQPKTSDSVAKAVGCRLLD